MSEILTKSDYQYVISAYRGAGAFDEALFQRNRLLAHDAALRERPDETRRERDLLRDRLDQFEAYGMPNIAAALDRFHAAEARAEKAEADAGKLRPLSDFGRAVVEEYFNDGEFGDLDGGWVQDKAVELGLLVHPTTPHSPDDCEGCADEPGSCYVLDAALAQPVPEKE